MNKIQVLIDNGIITDNDIQEYISSNQEYNEQEELNDDWFNSQPDTTYVLASTSQMMEETYVFPCNENGDITSWSEIASLSLRYGNENWRDHAAVVSQLDTEDYTYTFVSNQVTDNSNEHNLYKRTLK